MPKNENPPLIVHVIYRLAIGGMENGLVNLVNSMPKDKYRHVIICMTNYTNFIDRISCSEVKVVALNKKPGKDIGMYYRVWKLLRQLKPAIVHTRNIGALDVLIPAFFAGVKCRIQGEHGRDISDVNGTNKKYILLRKLINPIVNHYIALSKDLEQWLLNSVNVNPFKITQLYNGVDVDKFTLGDDVLPPDRLADYRRENCFVIGAVGRLQGEKDQLTLVKSFELILQKSKQSVNKNNLRLVLIGDGILREEIESYVAENNLSEWVWMPGARDDVPNILKYLDVFVLPSLIEGISNTILEAMMSELPVVATNVGGNAELVNEDETGYLVPSKDPHAMAAAILKYIDNNTLAKEHGKAGRERVINHFSMDKMINSYVSVYDAVHGV